MLQFFLQFFYLLRAPATSRLALPPIGHYIVIKEFGWKRVILELLPASLHCMTNIDYCLSHSLMLIVITPHGEIPAPRIFCTKHFFFNILEQCFASDKTSAQVSNLFSRSSMKHCRVGILTAR